MCSDIVKIMAFTGIIFLMVISPVMGDLVVWDGGGTPPDQWFVSVNWSSDVLPAEGDDAVDDVGPLIFYDEASPGNDDPGIATFTGSGAGTYSLTLLQEATLTVKTNMAYSGTGTYTIDVAQEALVSIGDAAGNFGGPFAASTSGFNWFVRGHVFPPLDLRGVVEVTDRIFGSGEWTTECLDGFPWAMTPWACPGGSRALARGSSRAGWSRPATLSTPTGGKSVEAMWSSTC